jgi:hypothetical protein
MSIFVVVVELLIFLIILFFSDFLSHLFGLDVLIFKKKKNIVKVNNNILLFAK